MWSFINSMLNPQLILLMNLLATWYMVGLIWMVQVVHYAMFDRVGSESFAAYAQDHSRLITPVVMFAMLIELATAAGLCWLPVHGVSRTVAWLGLGMVLAIWCSTALLQVPCHQRLVQGFDLTAYRTLVLSNWIRTILWTARGLLMAWVVWRVLADAASTTLPVSSG